ncbi:MAG TPA: PEP-utilizing enzyme [Burkholderiales bacterium]|nr:PEP-utilizing enzyme [Burkholderiales bacterium]
MAEKVWVCDDEPSTRYPVWTRGNVGEVFIEAVSPLTWSTYGRLAWEPGWREAFYEMGSFAPEDFRPSGQCEVCGCFGGYVYINMSVTRVMAVRVPGLTVEAMDRSLFGDAADVPPYRPQPLDENAARTAAVTEWLQSLPRTDPRIATDDERKRLHARFAPRSALSSRSDRQLLETFRALSLDGRRNFKRHVLNTYAGNVLASMIAQTCQAVEAANLTATITAGAGEIDSAGQSLDLWALSRTIAGSPALGAEFDAGIDGLLDRLAESTVPDARHFLERWNGFIERWGCIGPSVWEFRSPTYRTHPEIALRMLDKTRLAPDSAAPDVRTADLRAARESAIGEMSNRLAANPQARDAFIAAAHAVGHYMAARESSKLNCTLVIDEARQSIRELGQRLVARGHVAQWEHVLLVNNAEADAFLADPASWAQTIAQRAARLEVLKAKDPPFVFEGEPPPLSAFKDRENAVPASTANVAQLTGLGVSPGRHTGRARLVTSLDLDTRLEPGEVIVAITTDASWGPLFLAAGAIVVETGAMVSHAAIVARELGIPAAVSVSGAMRRIPSGAMITVDGNSGVVIVH